MSHVPSPRPDARLVLLGEQPPRHRRDAERAEERRRRDAAGHASRRAVGAAQRGGPGARDAERAKRAARGREVGRVRRRETAPVGLLVRLAEGDEPLGVRQRERPKEDAVDHGEGGSLGAELDAFVELLRQHHRLFHGEAQLARSFLLQF